jgi:hypothetical protein
METAIEQLDIPPDRSFSYDGRFIISRVTDKDGNLVRELRYDAGLADWVPMPIKHGKRKGGIRVLSGSLQLPEALGTTRCSTWPPRMPTR